MTWTIQQSFNRGELTPKLHARSDTEHWKGALANAVNVIVMRQGGVMRRPPFLHYGMLNRSRVRLFPFIFNKSQSFVFVIGDKKLTVWSPITGLVPGIDIDVPWENDDLDDIHFDQSGDNVFLCHQSYPTQIIQRISNQVWHVVPYVSEDGPYMRFNKTSTRLNLGGTGSVIDSGAVAFGDGATLHHEPVVAFDGRKDTYFESTIYTNIALGVELTTERAVCGYMIRSAPMEAVQQASKYSTGVYKFGDEGRASFSTPRNWLFQGFDDVAADWVTLDQQYAQTGWGPNEARYYKFNNTAKYKKYRLFVKENNDSQDQREFLRVAELTMTGYGDDAGVIQIQSVPGVDEINRGQGFLMSDIGRFLRVITDDGAYSVLKVKNVLGADVIEAYVTGRTLPTAGIAASWQLGSWSDTTGYPGSVAFLKERSVFSRNRESPQTMWLSRTGNYYNHGLSDILLDTDAINLTLDQPGPIQWIAEVQDLFIGTDGASRTLGPGEQTGALSPKSFNQKRQSTDGYASVQPANFGTAAIAVGRFRQNLREFKFAPEAGSYQAPDISILSEHLLRPGVKHLAAAIEPYSICWILTLEGTLLSMTYESAQRMIAITRHKIGGGGIVESFTIVPGPFGDQMWAAIRYGDRLCLQVMAQAYEDGDSRQYPYLDGLVLQNTTEKTRAFTGADHLIGMQVQAYGDGATVYQDPDDWDISMAASDPGNIPTTKTLTTGSLTLPEGAESNVIGVGLPYFSGIETLRVTYSAGGDSGLGRKANVGGMIVDVYQTGNVWCWSKTHTAPTEINLRSINDYMDEAIPLYTGALDRVYNVSSWHDSGQIWIGTVSPTPMTIRAIVANIEAE